MSGRELALYGVGAGVEVGVGVRVLVANGNGVGGVNHAGLNVAVGTTGVTDGVEIKASPMLTTTIRLNRPNKIC